MDEFQAQITLVSILEEKLNLLRTLLELTRAQADALADEEVEPFARNLDERQKTMDLIDSLDAKAGRMAAELDGKLPSASEADARTYANVDRIGALSEQIQQTLKQIVELDSKNQVLAQKKMDGYRGELRETRESIRSADAYIPVPVMEDGIYFDTKK